MWKLRGIVIIVVLLSSGLEFVSGARQARVEGWQINQQNQAALLRPLREALVSTGGIGRVYFSGPCHAGDWYLLPCPRLSVQSPTRVGTGLRAVRYIFKNDRGVTVTQGGMGMIRIWIGNPSIGLLQTRIGSLTLTPSEQYNAMDAITAIENAQEFQIAMRRLGFKAPLTIVGMSVTPPEEGLPHLPKSLKNVTVDEALDQIARTFGGIVFYGTCVDAKGDRWYRFDFSGGATGLN